jgi:hypothetical protein
MMTRYEKKNKLRIVFFTIPQVEYNEQLVYNTCFICTRNLFLIRNYSETNILKRFRRYN